MPLPSSPRRMLVAGWLAAAVTLAGCNDSTSPPRPLTPDELESFGEIVALEVESGITSLVANDLLGTAGGGEPFAAGRPRFDRAELAAVDQPECATSSQTPILDDDEDNIPNDVVFTFARPACEFTFETTTIAVTGSIRLVDVLPQDAGFGYNATLNDLTVSISDPEFGTINAGRDGTMGVAVSPTLLTLSQNLTLNISGDDIPATGVTTLINATFAPATALVAGQPLPNGVFTPSSTVSVSQLGQNVTFTLSAPTPLQYNATCAAEGEASVFTAGEARGTIQGPHGNGYVRVVWTDCQLPEVLWVATTSGS